MPGPLGKRQRGLELLLDEEEELLLELLNEELLLDEEELLLELLEEELNFTR